MEGGCPLNNKAGQRGSSSGAEILRSINNIVVFINLQRAYSA